MAEQDRTPDVKAGHNWDEVEPRLLAALRLCHCRESVGEGVASDGVRRLLAVAVGFLPGEAA